MHKVILGDCRELMAKARPESIDAIVCDPPYELGFMGKAWDASGVAYDVETWRAALQVLKPGAHLLAFGGTRTYHRMAVAIEDAGFEVRDCIVWLYGSGFPKSLDVSKAIDREAGAERRVIGTKRGTRGADGTGHERDTPAGQVGVKQTATDVDVTEPATPEAKKWQGWGTALKPANEPIIVARKPLAGTVAQNVQRHGSGGINVDGGRVGDEYTVTHSGPGKFTENAYANGAGWDAPVDGTIEHDVAGRWPANLVLDELVAPQLDAQAGYPVSPWFYCAKAGSAERNAGLAHLEPKSVHRYGAGIGEGEDPDAPAEDRNVHPTVKPIELMRWLVRLVTPPGGTVLDPFTGSGTTGCAAVLEGFDFIGLEREAPYVEIAKARIAFWSEHPPDVPLDAALGAERRRVELAEAGQSSLFGG
jgi:DNA modification methylase